VNDRSLPRAFAALMVAMAMLTGHVLAPAPPAQAVVGGDPIPIEQAPWQAVVYVEADNRLCGGAIVDASWIVTAAHCVVGFSASQVDAHVGITELRQRTPENAVDVSEVIVHPSWDANRFRNDIALLKLAAPINLDGTRRPIWVPVGLDAAQWPAAGTPASISGWGATVFDGPASDVLRGAALQILGGPGDIECGRYGGDFDVAVEICAGLPDASVDTCQGDSGSPLVVDVGGVPILAGLTSVGFECARIGFPGIYTRVSSFVPWLQEYLPSSQSPLAPQAVQVTPLSEERLRVDWLAPRVAPAAPIAGYRAVVEPTGASCSTGPGELACVIPDVPSGRLSTVTVSVLDASGGETFAEPVQAVSVDGVTSTGVRVRPNRLAQWAGLRARKVDDIRLAVRPASANICKRVGTLRNPRGVRTESTGLCAVRVTVVRPNGTKRRAIAYVDVR